MNSMEIKHPVWCSPDRCTAPDQRPTEYAAGAPQEHRSAPISGQTSGTAYLTQAIAPWECSVILRIETEPDALNWSTKSSFALEPGSPLLLVVRQHVAELEARFPLLMPPVDLGGGQDDEGQVDIEDQPSTGPRSRSADGLPCLRDAYMLAHVKATPVETRDAAALVALAALRRSRCPGRPTWNNPHREPTPAPARVVDAECNTWRRGQRTDLWAPLGFTPAGWASTAGHVTWAALIERFGPVTGDSEDLMAADSWCAKCSQPIEPTGTEGSWWHGGIVTDHEAVPAARHVCSPPDPDCPQCTIARGVATARIAVALGKSQPYLPFSASGVPR